jgi:copper transporter 1
MQKMDGCGDYVSMCKAGSLVPQCKTETIPKMITTSKTTLDVINMCSQMDMPGCSSCTSSKCGDPLFSISQVCLSMEMERCLGWTTMCQSIAADGEGGHMSFFCGKDPSHLAAVPLMRMYFHTGYLDYVLFKGWVATSFVQYLFSILAIIFTAMLTVFLKSWRLHSDEETRLASIQKSRESDPLLSDSRIRKRKRLVPFWKHMIPSSIQLRENCRRMIFAFFILILDYCLMLIAMSFNVGYFFAVILGVALGTLLWGHELVFSISDNCCD